MRAIREPLQAELLTEPAELARIEDRWRALAEAAGNPFVTPEWLDVWLDTWRGSFQPFVIVVSCPSGEACGVLPLACSTDWRRELRFPSAGDFFELLASPGQAEAVAAAVASCLRSLRPRWRRATLRRAEAEATWVRSLLDGDSPFRATKTGMHELPFLDLRGLTWDSFLASRSANFRGQAQRKLRALERGHAVRFRRTTQASELTADLDTLLRLHRRRREERGSALNDPHLEAVLRDFAARALERDWLRL